ncbi:cytochrome P450 302a1, mitochondrial [Contarinia nasturtii]|uniref:cytochrome P450 302a1, mitochondrial n=1 Tax=Contarinia nasturtii TaxID=265458 RepID=UPI0012D4308D|nr:cytochrome P450 302a1, mitochondrial [Contarinia nasturtii]XP_031640917.1 cytochrome P450 302a1, mitochondrial [Contarinia nasturtii]XP_031640918.1 cytochrome P450 302a1, mitochondrial [Contarinia nasturtii]XP_031640919.1 cytochrome P450 302a1, mitochondrial [Contarinia nasturtii]
MLYSTGTYKKCKNIRHFANVALKEKETSNRCFENEIKASTKTATKTSITNLKAKKYDDIPGPKGIFGIGTFYHYFPVFGKYSWDEVHKSGLDKYSKYGDIVKERMVPGVDIIWLYDPNDISKVLNNSGPDMYPQRKSHLGLEKYRKDRPHIYKTGGLLPTNGREWWRLRSEFQKGLSSPNHIRQFLNDSDKITKEFVSQVQPTIDTENVADFLPELSRLNLELVCYLAFDVRMHSFTDKERHPKSHSTRLIQAAEDSNSCLIPLDQGFPIWRYIETPIYRKFRLSQEYMESVAVDLVSQKISYFDDSNGAQSITRRSLLDDYLLNPKLDLADVVGMACDLLLAGVDTTTYSTCFLLYHLARNPNVQEKVFQEALTVLPNYDTDEITVDKMANYLTYSKAVLKETFRLNAVSVGVGRFTNTDLVLSGYNVPKGTIIVTQNYISCRLAKHFELPLKFMPERWLKNSDGVSSKTAINPYLVLPFSHGMRSCIARRFAEQNMLVLMLRIIRKYEIGWAGVEYLDVKTTTTINKPEHPVKLTFKKRPN